MAVPKSASGRLLLRNSRKPMVLLALAAAAAAAAVAASLVAIRWLRHLHLLGGEPSLAESAPASGEGCDFFLLEVSGRPERLTARARCAVESAARAHPQKVVCLLIGRNGGAEEQLALEVARDVFRHLRKVSVRAFDPDIIFAGSPVSDLWREHFRGRPPSNDAESRMLSNMARAALVWRHGGIYLDLDMIVLRPLWNLADNFAGIARNYPIGQFEVNNAVLRSKHPRSLFLEEHLARMPAIHAEKGGDLFSKDLGPRALTAMMFQWCKESLTRAPDISSKVECSKFPNAPTVTLYQPEIFYPIHQKKELFRDISNKDTKEILDEVMSRSFAVHLGASATRDKHSNNGASVAPRGTLLWELAGRGCPRALGTEEFYSTE